MLPWVGFGLAWCRFGLALGWLWPVFDLGWVGFALCFLCAGLDLL